MGKRLLKGRIKDAKGRGKTTGRSWGPMVYNEIVGYKVTPKVNASIMAKQKKKQASE